MKYILILLMNVSFLFGAVDINNASQQELTSLKGIGVKKAGAILEYRKDHCFKTVEELTDVKGIGPKFIEKHKDELETGDCKK